MPSDDFGDNEDFSDALPGQGSEHAQANQQKVTQDDTELDLYSGVGDVPDDLDSTAVPSEAGQESQQQQQQHSDGPVASQPTASTANRPSLTIVTNTAAPAGSSLYIGNLQWWTTDSELENLCAKHGQVLNIKTFEDKTTGKSKGYVLVQFGTADSAAACQAALHSTNINGKACVVTAVQGSGNGRPATSAPTASAPSTSGRSAAAVRPTGSTAQGRSNPPHSMGNGRFPLANGHMNGHMEPDQFFGGMPAFPNMSMGPQMGMGPPMGMGMGMGLGPMGVGMMNPMAMQMPLMPGMFQPPPPPRDLDRRRPRNDFDDYDSSYKRGRY